MAIGKYISLEEARKAGDEARFAKEHQSTGDKNTLLGVIDAMIKRPESGDQTSNLKHHGED